MICFYYWKQKFRTLDWGSMCSNPCGSEVTCQLILTFRTKDLVNFFFKGFRSTLQKDNESFLRTFSQVSSMKLTTKVHWFLIDDWRSTVILRKWIDIDRWYQPYSPVSESALTVDIDRDWSAGLINLWIGVDIWIGVGTISHHAWDHGFLVDVCPGPLLTTFGTICQWSFFWTSESRQNVTAWLTTFVPYESTLTVSFDWFFSEINGWCDINRIFK